MAQPAAKQAKTGEIVASWVPPSLADELKQQAKAEDRSVSAVVRRAVQDQLRGKR